MFKVQLCVDIWDTEEVDWGGQHGHYTRTFGEALAAGLTASIREALYLRKTGGMEGRSIAVLLVVSEPEAEASIIDLAIEDGEKRLGEKINEKERGQSCRSASVSQSRPSEGP